MAEVVISTDQLEQKIKDALEDVPYIKAIDLSDGCGSKFEITVVSERFAGKPLLAQHRLIHKVSPSISEYNMNIHMFELSNARTRQLNWNDLIFMH